jgi:hypothetical protein
MVDFKPIIKQIDTVLAQWKKIDAAYDPFSADILFINDPTEKNSLIFARMMATIERCAPLGSSYRSNAAKIQTKFPGKSVNESHDLNRNLAGVLGALREDYVDNRMQKFQEIIHADLFEDILEEAEYLLTKKYKDAAAVMIGSVLETHIKKMCVKEGLPLEIKTKGKSTLKRAGDLNVELAKHGVYDLPRQQQITAWMSLRNKAAHGEITTYKKEEIDSMHQGVRQFIELYPA